jgi:hypothetical protein
LNAIRLGDEPNGTDVHLRQLLFGKMEGAHQHDGRARTQRTTRTRHFEATGPSKHEVDQRNVKVGALDERDGRRDARGRLDLETFCR